MNRVFSIVLGFLDWRKAVRKYHIDNKTVVLFLPENVTEWNKTALKYLPQFMSRKKANRAVVLVHQSCRIEKTSPKGKEILFEYVKGTYIKNIMAYYTLHRFSDKVVFFYLDYPRDNYSKIILRETEVSMDELICLGLYRLREVPEIV